MGHKGRLAVVQAVELDLIARENSHFAVVALVDVVHD